MSKQKYSLSPKEQLLYSISFFPNILMAGVFGLTYVNFFWDDLQMQQFYFSLGMIIYAVINSLNDFYMGRLSDNTNIERWKSRRLIYMKWGGLLWAFIFFSMWFPWSYTNQIIILIHFLVSLVAFDSMASLVWLVWTAVLPEMTDNLEERNRVMLYSQIFAMLAIFPVIFSLFIYEAGLVFFQLFAGICAIICALCHFIPGSKLNEQPELYVPKEKISLYRSLKEVFKSKSFITNTIFRSFRQINITMPTAFLFAFIFLIEVDLLTASFLFTINSVFIGLVSKFVYQKLSKKYDMRTLVIIGQSIQITVHLVGFFIIVATQFYVLVWIFLFINGLASGFALFDYPLLMLISDEDEVNIGSRRDGTIIGSNVFFIKITESLTPILATSVLLAFGFVQGASSQTSQAQIGILFLFYIIPAIVEILAMIGMILFPLHGKKLKEMSNLLYSKREKNP